jgi:CRP/FNR family transcriptional regulator, cyclic AMP receptor protein
MTNQLALTRAALERTRVTSTWPEAAVEKLCADAELRVCHDEERVIAAGDEIDAMWIVSEGTFLLSRAWRSGRRFLYSYIEAGQTTGILPVFDGAPAAFDVTARGDGTMLVISGRALRDVAKSFPEVALEIIAYLCRRTRVDYEAIEMHAMNSVRCRIAKTILWLTRGQTGSSGSEIVIDSKITQEDLADMVSAARQSVNRELRGLMKEGILKQRYRSLVVLNRERLIRAASEDEVLSPVAFGRLSTPATELYPTTD